MRHATTLLVALLTITPLASATAQVRPGARVRVTHPWGKSVGTFLAWKADSLVMESNGNAFALALDSVTALEVSVGQRSQAGVGAGVGGVIGFVIGAVGGATGCADDVIVTSEQCAIAGGLVFGVGGALLGAVVGATTKTDRWVAVPLDRLRVSFAPQRDGRLGLGLSVRF